MDSIILSGTISVKAAIEANIRPVFEISLAENKRTKDFSYIKKICDIKKIPVRITDRTEIDALTENQTNGGICARVGTRTFAEPQTLLARPNPFIVFAEGIEDPYNFGYLIRNIYAAGATGLVIPNRNWTSADHIVIRASAGASEFIPTASVDRPADFLTQAKSAGLTVIAADRKDATSLYETDLTGPIVLLIGGQLRGLSRSVSDLTDTRVYIPYGNEFRNALPAAGASAVIAFEIFRQRHKK